MPKRDGAAVHVHDRLVDAEHPRRVARDGGEGFVDLHPGHVGRRSAGPLEREGPGFRRRTREVGKIVRDGRLPDDRRKDLEATFALLVEQPNIGAEVPQASSPDIRRLFVDRIRYWAYYRVRGGRLEVVSVWHSSRGTGPLL